MLIALFWGKDSVAEKQPLIVTAAITGGDYVSKYLTPYVPSTVDEVVEETVRVRRAGASVVHLHAKDPETGGPALDPNPILKKYVEGIRESEASDIIINVTTGGGRFVDPGKLDDMMKERTTFGQEMCSLNMGSINLWKDMGVPQLRDMIFGNPINTIARWAGYMYENGVKPELEIYDTGMINAAKRLVAEGALREPIHVQFVMFDGLSCMSPNLKTLLYCVESIPGNWVVCLCPWKIRDGDGGRRHNTGRTRLSRHGRQHLR